MITTLIELENYLQDTDIIDNALMYRTDSTLTYSFDTTMPIEETIPQLVHIYCVYTLIENDRENVEYINELQYTGVDDYYELLRKLDKFFTNSFKDIEEYTDRPINNEIVYKLFKYIYIELNTIISDAKETNTVDYKLSDMQEFINKYNQTFIFPYDYAFYDSFTGVYNASKKGLKVAPQVEHKVEYKVQIPIEYKSDVETKVELKVEEKHKTPELSTKSDVLSDLYTDVQLIKAILVAKPNEELSDKKIDAVYNVLELFDTLVDKQLIKKILELYNRL